MSKELKEIVIYQAENGAIEFKGDFNNENFIWGTQKQISDLFGTERSVITKHINNIIKTAELEEKSNVQKMHIANSDKPVKFYSLDVILAVGYRTNSVRAIEFRKWATKTLKQHITKGFTINQKVLLQNKKHFLKTLNDLKILTENNPLIESKDILSLIQSFSDTFFDLERFDKNIFPKQGRKQEINISAQQLHNDLQKLKKELIKKGEATELFAQEKKQGSLQGIFGSVFQSVFGQDAYPTVEEKSAHLLYFIIKNHPFNDGNKRSGAFAFIWLLQKANYDFTQKISPQTLTTLTLLIALSPPTEKEKMIGLILLLLN